VSTQDPNDPLVGTTLVGRYQLLRIVADGGMGRVYEGSDLAQQGRRVAVKVLHQDIASDPVNIERFKREAETSQALPNPYITEVYDFARPGTSPVAPRACGTS